MPYVRRFLWRVRRIQRSAPAPGEVADPKIGRFAAHQQSNVDQVPMEDEAKDGAYTNNCYYVSYAHVLSCIELRMCVYLFWLICLHCDVKKGSMKK